jgi:hypothetical protein
MGAHPFNALVNMHASLPSVSTANANNGMWYVFRDGGDVIRAWGSDWMGLERIYFNDQLLVVGNHLKRVDQVSFQHSEHHYELRCRHYESHRWLVRCTLIKNGVQLYSIRCKRKRLFDIRPTFAHLVAGLAAGILAGLIKAPAWSGIGFIFFALSLTLLTLAKTDDFVIEEDFPLLDS